MMAKGVCRETDILIRNWAPIAVESLKAEVGDDILELDDLGIHELITEWLKNKGIMNEQRGEDNTSGLLREEERE